MRFGVRHHGRADSISKRAPSPLPHLSPFELLAFRVVFEAGEADERLACGARLRLADGFNQVTARADADDLAEGRRRGLGYLGTGMSAIVTSV